MRRRIARTLERVRTRKQARFSLPTTWVAFVTMLGDLPRESYRSPRLLIARIQPESSDLEHEESSEIAPVDLKGVTPGCADQRRSGIVTPP